VLLPRGSAKVLLVRGIRLPDQNHEVQEVQSSGEAEEAARSREEGQSVSQDPAEGKGDPPKNRIKNR
jgi:hypothetical protein